MNLKKISADEARNVRKDHFRGDSDIMLKAARGPSSWDESARSARFVMSSQAVDRYGDIVVTAGLNLDQFGHNPIALLSHNATGFSIGNWHNIEKIARGRPPRMEGDLVLHKSGGPVDIIDKAAWYIKNGYMRGASIGFVPNFDAIEMIMDDDGSSWTGGLQFNEAEIVECSVCNIPANPDALVKATDYRIHVAKEFIEEILETWEKTADGAIIPRGTGKSAMEHAEAYAALAGMKLYNPAIERPVSEKKFTQMESAHKHARKAEQRAREVALMRYRSVF